MRKLMSLILALLLCFSVCGTAFAAEDDFVPSITYKDGPGLIVEEDGEGNRTVGTICAEDEEVLDNVAPECLVVTTIAEALENVETGIPTEAEALLEEVYQQLLDGSMELPFENPDEMVIIHLVDATMVCKGTTEGTDHDAMLEAEGVYLELSFDLGVGADVPVSVMCYVDGQWVAVRTVNNGNGTVTCWFEQICPIAFAVPASALENTPATGDRSGAELGLWIALLAVSTVALSGLVIFRRKIVR